MKLLLNSTGFESGKIRSEFLKFFDKGIDDLKVVFLHTSARGFEERFLEEMRKHWVLMGFGLENLNFVDMDKWKKGVLDFDVVCVCGGNTFYILDRMKKCGVFENVGKAVNEGAVYIGMSAGSIIAGPDIEVSGRGSSPDVNDIDLEDFIGLGFTDKIIIPHYGVDDERDLVEFEKEREVEVVRLRDGEALVVDGDVVRVVG
jgi:dipeptidase E